MSTSASNLRLVDLRAQFASIEADVRAAIERVLTSQVFINGPETAAFEREFATFSGLEHVVAVSNGTTALELALAAAGVGDGDEVVTVSHTFFATVEAILRVGATPVLVDVRADEWTIDPERVADAVSPRTKAVVPVHLYGLPADVAALRDAAPGAAVVEDAAQAHGAAELEVPVGRRSAAATFSFFPAKNLGAYGDAGAVGTDSRELAALIARLRDHGRAAKYEHDLVGTNARVGELQAAVLRAKLPHLAAWLHRRRELAARYEEALAGLGVEFQTTSRPVRHGRHLFVIRHAARDRIAERLGQEGIETGVHYPIPLHRQPALSTVRWRAGSTFEVTDQLAGSVLSLPLYPELRDEDVDRVCEAVARAL